jgi:hypothetical protein
MRVGTAEVKRLHHKDYTVTPGAKYEERTGQYAPTVHIAWPAVNGTHHWISFTSKERCPTFHAAIAVALEEAKKWADRCLVHVGPEP